MTWLAKGGGVDNNVLLTIEGLKNEFEFHLAVGNEIYHNPFDKIEGIKFIQCMNLVRPLHPIKDLKALLFFIRLIKKEKYAVVHTHETKASLVTRLAAWFAGCKYIIYGLHGVTFNDPMSKLKRRFYIALEKYTTGVSDLIVSVSSDAVQHYHNNNIGKNIPFKIVHSGIDLQKFSNKAANDSSEREQLKASLNIQPNEIVIINIGRFSFSKAQRYTIESFAELKKQFASLKLLFVGEGELMDECKMMVRNLKLENDVIFKGFSDNIAKLLSISDIHVLTSLREGLPRVAVEASLIKVATVAFEVEGIREVIENEKSGFIVPQYDVKSLTEKIKMLVEDKEKRNLFAERAYQHVMHDWDSKVMIQQLREIYNTGILSK